MMSSEEGWKPPTRRTEPPNGVPVDSLERGDASGEQEATRRWVSGLFVDALVGERRSGGRRLDRPGVAAIATATIVCLGITIGLAAWPGVSYRLTHAGAASHVAVTARETTRAPQPGRADTGAAGAQPPVAEPIQSSSESGQLPPATAPPPAAPAAAAAAAPAAAAPAAAPPPVTVVNQPQQAPPPPPPVTFASTEVVGPGSPYFVTTGSWNSASRGGYPNFTGPILWTGDTSARASWSIGNPGGGQRWDQTRVRVWIPDPLGGAVVRYTVRWPTVSSNVQTFDVAQETTNNWYELGVFNIGTATQRTGSIWIDMTYIKAYYNPSDPACPNGQCWSMGAAQVEFAWS